MCCVPWKESASFTRNIFICSGREYKQKDIAALYG